MFSSLSKSCTRTDIVFDLYLQQSIKQGERNRRTKLEPIETNISTIKQHLPLEMDRFWSSSDNNVKFQQAFIKCMTSNGQSDIPVYHGGASTEDITSCIQVRRGETIRVPSLKNDHEEADDRIFYHLNHSIKDDGFQIVVTASAGADVFICAIYHYNR